MLTRSRFPQSETREQPSNRLQPFATPNLPPAISDRHEETSYHHRNEKEQVDGIDVSDSKQKVRNYGHEMFLRLTLFGILFGPVGSFINLYIRSFTSAINLELILNGISSSGCSSWSQYVAYNDHSYSSDFSQAIVALESYDFFTCSDFGRFGLTQFSSAVYYANGCLW